MAIPVVRRHRRSAAEDGGVNIGKIYMLNRHRHRRHHRPHLNHDHSSSLVGCLIIFLYTLFTPPTRVHTHFVMSGRSMLAGDDDRSVEGRVSKITYGGSGFITIYYRLMELMSAQQYSPLCD